ncbi:MAG: hypothetical protein IJT99_00690 [Clostridia bacterium]|jgi:hypothetical protein|nr:hypothetical protein [Clostridia bacterium]
MVWAVIGIVVAIMAVAIYFALKAHNKLVAEGKIISRRTDFMENAEEFTLAAVDPSQVTDSVKAFDYNGMRVAMKGNSENQAFRFTGNNWGARLFRVSADEAQCVYRFEFTNWKTNGSMAEGAMGMNMLLTAVEKMFLSLDHGTQVRTVPLELKTKHSIL